MGAVQERIPASAERQDLMGTVISTDVSERIVRRAAGGRRRLLLVLSNGDLGGAQEIVVLLARFLDQNRYEVSVVCPDSPSMERLSEIPGIKRFVMPFPTLPSIATANHLASIIRSEHIQIIHTHLFHGDFYGWMATRLAPVPVLASTIQGVNFFWELDPFPRRLTSWLFSKGYRGIYRSFDGIAACSEAVKQAIASRPGLRVWPQRVRVIHNSVDVEQLRVSAGGSQGDTMESDRRKTQNTGERIVTVVANFAPFKGHTVFLEAVRRLLPEVPVRCLLVGDGPNRRRVERKARSLGLTGVVEFLGYRRDVPRLLRTSDLVVLPSIWEPFGLAVVEAMVLGVPVVACGSGGTPEILIDGRTGLLAPPGDPEALANRMKRVLMDSELASRLTDQARVWAESRFNAQGMVSAYQQWYEELIISKCGIGEML